MKVSIHAAQRFLERVMSKANYTSLDVNAVMSYLERLLKDVVPGSRSTQFALPGFEKYKVVYVDNTVVTIIPKRRRYSQIWTLLLQ